MGVQPRLGRSGEKLRPRTKRRGLVSSARMRGRQVQIEAKDYDVLSGAKAAQEKRKFVIVL